MGILYSWAVGLYSFGIWIAAFFKPKARKLLIGQNYAIAAAKKVVKTGKLFWFHCASVGEFEQARPLIESLKNQSKPLQIVLTFFSPSGYELHKKYRCADYVLYLPRDTAKNARIFLDSIQPDAVFFIKYEFWHFFTLEISRRKIPLYSLNSIFRPQQLFFKPYGGFYRAILYRFDYFFVQTPQSAALLQDIGIKHCSVVNDTRFDRVLHIAQQSIRIDIAEKFVGAEFTMVVGSAWPPDIAVVAGFARLYQHPIRFIVAPHELDEQFFEAIETAFPTKTIRFSKCTADSDFSRYGVLLVDNIGMLSSLYRYGDVAFVGGAYGAGLHNILEAAVYGCPVVFGNKNFKKYNEAVELIACGGAFAVGDAYELCNLMNSWDINKARIAAQEYVRSKSGGTQIILQHILPLL